MNTTDTTEWGLQQVWNESLDLKEDRKFEPRDYLYATEVGGSLVDTYLKLKGIAPSNPFDVRSLRKFEAGNFWEWAVKIVLLRSGLLQKTQDRVGFQYPNCLRVSGRLDYQAGGKVDWNKAKVDVEEMIKLYDLPEFMARFARNVVNSFAEKYPNGLAEYIIDMKSSSSFMFDTMERTGKPDPKHVNQVFHYIKGKGMPEGRIVYLCKDDVRMLEFKVFNNEENEAVYKDWIEKISYHYKNGIQPEKEKEVEFNDEKGRFSANWKVGYSGYLTYLYGYQNQGEFDDKFRPMTERWNRVIVRAVEGKDMTKANLDVIEEVKQAGFDWDKVVNSASAVKGTVVEEVLENDQ